MNRGAAVLSCLFLALTIAVAWAETVIFEAEAAAPIGPEGIVTAKIQARNEALRKAVLQAIMQNVPPDRYEAGKNLFGEKILRKAMDYVQSYDILSSGEGEGGYKVKIEARINLDRLLSDVKALKISPDVKEKHRKRDRLLLVVTKRWQDAEQPFSDLLDPLLERLETVDLECLTGDPARDYLLSEAFLRFKERRYEQTYEQAAGLDARYVLVVRSLIVSGKSGDCPDMATAWLIDAKQGEMLAEASANFEPHVGCRQASQEVAKKLFSQLADRLKGKGVFDSAPVVALRLVIRSVRTYPDTVELSGLLRRIPDLKTVEMHSFATGGDLVYRVSYEGSTQDLAAALEKLKIAKFKLVRRAGTDENLTFEAVY